jgi:hypothetical protein
MAIPKNVTINGTSYESANLSEAARDQIANVQVVDAEIAYLQRQLIIAQTARNAYGAALAHAVAPPAEEPAKQLPGQENEN